MVGILVLSLAVLKPSDENVPAKIQTHPSPLPFLIFSVLLLAFWLYWERKNVTRPILRQKACARHYRCSRCIFRVKKIRDLESRRIILCIIFGFIWIFYWIMGVSISTRLLKWLALALIICAIILFVVLLLSVTKRKTEGEFGRFITSFAQWVDNMYWPLLTVEMLASVILTWNQVWSAGERSGWMTPLFILGVLIAFVVPFIQSRVHVTKFK